jgi:hypothetical protein
MAQGTLPCWGTDLLVFLAASGWATSPGLLSSDVTVGPTSARTTAVCVNHSNTHTAFVRRRVFVTNVPPGSLPVTITAGARTVTDGNDRVNVTIIQRGTSPIPFYVREAQAGPPSSRSSFVNTTFLSVGGLLMISAAGSGYSTAAANLTGMSVLLDGQTIAKSEVFANAANSHLAFVPVDLVIGEVPPGNHSFALVPEASTTIDANDFYSLTVVELVCPPAVMTATQVLANAVCNTQDGGGTIASGSFTSSGGVLLVCVSVSAYTHTAGQILSASIQIDGRTVGSTELCANAAQTHLCLTGNDLPLSNIMAGRHTVTLVASSATVTDFNDRCSLTVLEIAKSAP